MYHDLSEEHLITLGQNTSFTQLTSLSITSGSLQTDWLTHPLDSEHLWRHLTKLSLHDHKLNARR
jgi:hypothetical protein